MSFIGTRSIGKGLDEPCLICGERRFTERAHFPKRKRPGEDGVETIPLCPTHHKLLDFGRLNSSEFELIMRHGGYDGFSNVSEFIKWANENYYPYSEIDLKRKFWNYCPQHAASTMIAVANKNGRCFSAVKMTCFERNREIPNDRRQRDRLRKWRQSERRRKVQYLKRQDRVQAR